MARPGRKPKPVALRVLEGNPGKRPLPNAPRPRPERPRCPIWLTGEARREWQRVVPELDRLGLLAQVDRAALAAYCLAWARLVEAEQHIRAHGAVGPWWAIWRQAAELVRKLASEFGLTPSSRSRLSLPEAADDDMGGLLD